VNILLHILVGRRMNHYSRHRENLTGRNIMGQSTTSDLRAQEPFAPTDARLRVEGGDF